MNIAATFAAELDYELPATRRLVERVPDDKGTWKPHPKSSAFGHLTQLVCSMPGIMADIVVGVDLDLAAVGYTFERTETLLRQFDANVARLRDVLEKAADDTWALSWNLRYGQEIVDTAIRRDALRNTINHFIHHRGQLTVYLRLNDVPVPQLYGPTADEPG